MSLIPANCYAVVEFTSEDDQKSVSVVASVWLTEHKSKSYWPPPTCNITRIAEKKETPVLTQPPNVKHNRVWTLHDCHVLKYFVDFPKAQRYCKKASSSLNPETTDAEHTSYHTKRPTRTHDVRSPRQPFSSTTLTLPSTHELNQPTSSSSSDSEVRIAYHTPKARQGPVAPYVREPVLNLSNHNDDQVFICNREFNQFKLEITQKFDCFTKLVLKEVLDMKDDVHQILLRGAETSSNAGLSLNEVKSIPHIPLKKELSFTELNEWLQDQENFKLFVRIYRTTENIENKWLNNIVI